MGGPFSEVIEIAINLCFVLNTRDLQDATWTHRDYTFRRCFFGLSYVNIAIMFNQSNYEILTDNFGVLLYTYKIVCFFSYLYRIFH